jgi:hypothetical protein
VGGSLDRDHELGEIAVADGARQRRPVGAERSRKSPPAGGLFSRDCYVGVSGVHRARRIPGAEAALPGKPGERGECHPLDRDRRKCALDLLLVLAYEQR